MQTGISLKISSDFDRSLWSLPPPSSKRWLSRTDGEKTLEVLYHFEYSPQSFREWQRIASIKIQMQELVPHLVFTEYESPDEVQRVYTIAELGKYFPKFIRFHKPLYPHSKDEYMRSLTFYCQRLYYEKQLHFEAVVAMALHFNSKCGFGYSHREVMRKAKSMFLLDMSEWKVKLTQKELQQAHAKGGHIAAEKKREKSQHKRDEALKLRESGMSLKDIATQLEVSLRTVNNWKLPKVKK
jgi:DNA-binding NarL/FixJ family response regulator